MKTHQTTFIHTYQRCSCKGNGLNKLKGTSIFVCLQCNRKYDAVEFTIQLLINIRRYSNLHTHFCRNYKILQSFTDPKHCLIQQWTLMLHKCQTMHSFMTMGLIKTLDDSYTVSRKCTFTF